MKRQHHMPFGTSFRQDGQVRFNLWAPQREAVDLSLQRGGDEIVLPMEPEPAGWFRLDTDQAAAGDLYCFRIDELCVPDPASRFQPRDVHGPSQIVDPQAFDWQDHDWTGRPWEEAVVYELHVGSFTPQGTFEGVIERLDYLCQLGVTAIELMPVADFPGRRNWGYDGALAFAPDSRYGTPASLKQLVQAAHARGLMVLLDVVYNHFGPEGNYLHTYAPQFFTERHQTPWGAAINYDGPCNRTVRDFFIHNALYWLTEYHLDGLRLDAVHAVIDDSQPHILTELAEAVRQGPAQARHIHLVLENDDNCARFLQRRQHTPRWYDAQWNDDIHHSLHVLLSGETDGYYGDYAERPAWFLGRCLTEGFAYQGEPSAYREGRQRGEDSRALPPTAFVNFLQNHDQIGNRAFGDRLAEHVDEPPLRAAIALLLLAPSPPLFFMGEEFGTRQRFPFFCDFGPDLAEAVSEGRRQEFARFARFADPAQRENIPDPNAERTFLSAKLPWEELETPWGQCRFRFYRQLLQLRQQDIVPRLPGMPGGRASFQMLSPCALRVCWPMGDGARLTLLTNLGEAALDSVDPVPDPLLFATDGAESALASGSLPGWSTAWFLSPEAAG